MGDLVEAPQIHTVVAVWASGGSGAGEVGLGERAVAP